MEQIKNDQLTLEISSLGAELLSIKDANGNEYLWDGDEKYWNRHSPILFPIVCGLWKDTYRTEGKEYHLPRHGFARDTEFKLVGKTATASPSRSSTTKRLRRTILITSTLPSLTACRATRFMSSGT